jgi:hypothetical protein
LDGRSVSPTRTAEKLCEMWNDPCVDIITAWISSSVAAPQQEKRVRKDIICEWDCQHPPTREENVIPTRDADMIPRVG